MTDLPAPEPSDREWLTVDEVLALLGEADGQPLPRRTWQQWRLEGRAPECHRLPNGHLRIHRPALDAWLARLKEDEDQP